MARLPGIPGPRPCAAMRRRGRRLSRLSRLRRPPRLARPRHRRHWSSRWTTLVAPRAPGQHRAPSPLGHRLQVPSRTARHAPSGHRHPGGTHRRAHAGGRTRTRAPRRHTTVSRASLHNRSHLERLDARVGDLVVVQKAGEIIPQVVEIRKESRPSDSVPSSSPRGAPSARGAGGSRPGDRQDHGRTHPARRLLQHGLLPRPAGGTPGALRIAARARSGRPGRHRRRSPCRKRSRERGSSTCSICPRKPSPR